MTYCRLALAIVALKMVGCTDGEIVNFSAFPPLVVGQVYEVKMAGEFSAIARLVNQRPGWIQMDFAESPGNGWASTVWMRQSEIIWFGEVDRTQFENARLMVHEEYAVQAKRIEELRATLRKDHPMLRKAVEKLNAIEQQIRQPESAQE